MVASSASVARKGTAGHPAKSEPCARYPSGRVPIHRHGGRHGADVVHAPFRDFVESYEFGQRLWNFDRRDQLVWGQLGAPVTGKEGS